MKHWIWHRLLINLKRWSRAGIYEMLDEQLNADSLKQILSIGGFGPVNEHIYKIVSSGRGKLTTLDIDEHHYPEILADVSDCSQVIPACSFDAVIAIEVFEHVFDSRKAIGECNKILKENGVLIFSTPWITPIHDRPFDFYRFTPEALKELCQGFSSVAIYARGNYFDSLVVLMLRGLFSKGLAPRIFLIIGTFLSKVSRLPKVYSDLSRIDSTIGYFVVAVK